MKKSIFLSTLSLSIMTFSYGQGWVGDVNGNNLKAINSSGTVANVRVGIGTTTPTASFHVSGGLRFETLQKNNLLLDVLVKDKFGNIFYRDLNSISNAWTLSGNSTNSTHFIGTTNSEDFRIRTNNIERMKILSGGNGYSNWNVDPTQFDFSQASTDYAFSHFYEKNDVYSPQIDLKNNSIFRGLKIHNTSAGNSGNGGAHADLTFISRDGTSNFEAQSIIASIATGANQSTLCFLVETSGAATVSEQMRISGNGNIGVHTTSPNFAFHTVGTVAHENLPSGVGVPLVINPTTGEIFRSSSITPLRINYDSDIEALRREIELLREELSSLKNSNENIVDPSYLKQNYPNPANQYLSFEYHIGNSIENAKIEIYNIQGLLMKSFNVIEKDGMVSLDSVELITGTYKYVLSSNGAVLDTKSLIIAH